MVKKQAERKAQNVKNLEVTESKRMSQAANEEAEKLLENKKSANANLDQNKNLRNDAQNAPMNHANNNQDQDQPMDVTKLNLDFLGVLSKGFSNFNPAANKDSKTNVSVLIGNKNVSVENKNVLGQ